MNLQIQSFDTDKKPVLFWRERKKKDISFNKGKTQKTKKEERKRHAHKKKKVSGGQNLQVRGRVKDGGVEREPGKGGKMGEGLMKEGKETRCR